jgi:ribosomal protein S18 acetylase RimI-like enzyme
MPHATDACTVQLETRAELEPFLRRRPFLHLYELGDLDDFFWPHTRWFGRRVYGDLLEVLLLYTAAHGSTLLAFTDGSTPIMADLLRSVIAHLPARVYAHLSEGLADELRADYALESHGRYLRLALTDTARLDAWETSEAAALRATGAGEVVPLHAADAAALRAFYDASYPGNWFDERMLLTGHYWGVRDAGRLVCAGGVHVVSPRQRVAALGNVATDPAYRGRGLATRTCARLCRGLMAVADHIGANVKADNRAALRCYGRLGFKPAAAYEEWACSRKPVKDSARPAEAS